MAKITKPEDIFSAITEDYVKVFGDDLISIILYGSAAGADYKPGKSDLNFLVTLTDEAIDHLDRAMEPVTRWRKKSVAVPLFMTGSYITSSLDSFPLEFLNMKTNYILVHGEDVLKDLSFDERHLRLQCEREIKGKLLLLREGFLDTEGKHKKIKGLISASITAFVSIFNGLLFLRGIAIPHIRREVIHCVAREFSIDPEAFLKCLDVKENKGDFSQSETKAIFKAYVREVRKLWEIVDKLSI
jgi:hypothetical protein